jgi:hypothetical protein
VVQEDGLMGKMQSRILNKMLLKKGREQKGKMQQPK